MGGAGGSSAAAAGSGGASGAAGQGGAAGMAPTSCPVAPEPAALPTVMATFLFEDPAMGITIPKATGGDPTGTWTISKSTVFLPDVGKGIVDTTMSTSAVTGFFAFEGTTYRSHFHSVTHLVTSLLGNIDSTSDTQSTGTYTTLEMLIGVTPKCLVTAGDGTTDSNIAYSVVGDTLTTITTLTTSQGNSILVTESTRVK